MVEGYGPQRAGNVVRTRPSSNRKQEVDMDVESLAKLLHETAERHDSFEKNAPPHDWWDWYAPYLHARQEGSTPDEASKAADRHMAEVKKVAREKR
jgi:hypothetical protein